MFIFLDTETTGNGPDDRWVPIVFKTENGTVLIDPKKGRPRVRTCPVEEDDEKKRLHLSLAPY
jgi:hypothetical protein